MLMIFIVLALLSLVTRSRWLTVTRMPKNLQFYKQPENNCTCERSPVTYMAASEGCPCKKKFGYLDDDAYPGEFEQKATVSGSV